MISFNRITANRGEITVEPLDANELGGIGEIMMRMMSTAREAAGQSPENDGRSVPEASGAGVPKKILDMIETFTAGRENPDGPEHEDGEKASRDEPTDGKGQDGEKKTCSVCLDEWEDGQTGRRLPCRHEFHTECIDRWLSSHLECPNCRTRVFDAKRLQDSKDTDIQEFLAAVAERDRNNRSHSQGRTTFATAVSATESYAEPFQPAFRDDESESESEGEDEDQDLHLYPEPDDTVDDDLENRATSYHGRRRGAIAHADWFPSGSMSHMGRTPFNELLYNLRTEASGTPPPELPGLLPESLNRLCAGQGARAEDS